MFQLIAPMIVTIARNSFQKWAEKEGPELIDRLAKEIKLTWFQRIFESPKSAAKKQLLSQAVGAVQSQALSVAIKQEANEYPSFFSALAERSENLIGAGNFPSRVVALPRWAVNTHALLSFTAVLGQSELLLKMTRGEAWSKYFIQGLVKALDEAYQKQGPSVKNPIPSTANHVVAGFDETFDWGFGKWPGNYFVVQGSAIPRSDREEIQSKIESIQSTLGALPAGQRIEMMQGMKFRTSSQLPFFQAKDLASTAA